LAYLQLKQLKNARAELESMTKARPEEEAEVLLGMGIIEQSQNRLTEAEVYFRQVRFINSQPGFFEQAQLRIGLGQLALQQPESAATTFLYLRGVSNTPHVVTAATVEAARAFRVSGDEERARFLLEELTPSVESTAWAEAVSQRKTTLPLPAKP
jgi:tetratricopeptide (TPR) repeat protein